MRRFLRWSRNASVKFDSAEVDFDQGLLTLSGVLPSNPSLRTLLSSGSFEHY